MNIRRPTHPIFGRLMYGVVLAMLIIAALGLGGFTPARAAPLAAPPPPPPAI